MAFIALAILVGHAAAAEAPASPNSIVLAGAERMVPWVQQLAAAFETGHPDIRFTVSGGGCDTGMRKLADGSAAAAMLSRPPTREECFQVRRRRGREPAGVPVAMDAVVFYVHPSNPLESLTLTELREILTFHTLYWTRIGFGEERIRLYMPPLSSGCNEVLRLRVLGTLGLPRKRNEFENHHRLFAALAQEPGALAFSGRAEECPVRVVPLKTDADSPAVLPTPSDVQARRYPLTHYLYLYTAGEPDEPLREFIAFVVSPAGQKIIGAARSGAVPLPFFVEAPD